MSNPATRTAFRRWDYLCQNLDGKFVYITADCDDGPMQSFRVLVGNGFSMKWVPIKGVKWSEKTGAYSMSTLDGAYVRLPLSARFVRRGRLRWLSKLAYRLSGDKPTMGGEMLFRLNPADYHICPYPDGKVYIS